MVSFVDPSTIKRRIPDAPQPVRSFRDPGAGDTFREIAGILGDIGERRDRSSLAKADNDFLLLKAEQDNAYNDDEEYGTIESRWKGEVETGLGNIAATITNPALREAFVAKHKVSVENGRERMELLARGKENDFERADLGQRLDSARNAAVESADWLSIYQNGVEMINSNIALNQTQRVKMVEGFRQSVTTGRLEFLPPELRMQEAERLKDHLAPDVYAKYKREAEAAVLDAKAQDAVDTVLADPGYDYKTAQANIAKLFKGDVKARDEANRRLDYENRKREDARLDEQKDYHNEYFRKIREGEMTVSEVPDSVMNRLDPSIISSFYSAQGAYSSRKAVKSDRTILFNLHRMNAAKDPAVKKQIQEYFIQNSHKLDATDFDSWAETVTETASPQVKSMLTSQQTIMIKFAEALTRGHKYSKDGERIILGDLNNWHMDYQEEHGKPPSDTERNTKIDDLLMRFPTTGWWWGSDEQAVFQMDENQLVMAGDQVKSRDPKIFKDAMQYVNDRNIDINTIEGKRLFLKMARGLKEKRDASK